MYIDYYYVVLVLPAVLFAMWTGARVNWTFRKYQNQYSTRGMTGAQAARYILDRNGLYHVRIEAVAGELTDHYDPSEEVIRLSSGVYNNTSTAAIGVACHEAGHAIQYAVRYRPIMIRMAIVPISCIGSNLAMPLFLIGLAFSGMNPFFQQVAYLGLLCFALSTLFELVTLPTEFDASRRALRCIKENQLLVGEEYKGAAKVLRAAALTYVASLAVSLTQLLRLFLVLRDRSDD